MPALRPLVLVLKALLKQNGLNEAAVGGLSSYALGNMVCVPHVGCLCSVSSPCFD
jgi:DNA polymerase sigma